MMRAEAATLVKSKVFGIVDAGQAGRWVDFFIAAGMLEVKEEEDKPIFEIKCTDSPLYIRIYNNGEITGIVGTVINRMPELIAKLMQNNS